MKTAWYDDKNLPNSMLNAGFKPLKESDHFGALDECVKLSDGKTLLDIGCGAAEVALTYPEWEYTGADLPHIISDVSKVSSPSQNYIGFDANETSFEFVKDYDLVLMNSFLSEVPEWYTILNKILIHATGDVLIHRQEVTHSESHLDNYITYGNLPTVKTVINYEDMVNTFKFNGFSIVRATRSFPYESHHRTFLFRKDQ
jgi:hypothetical protein